MNLDRYVDDLQHRLATAAEAGGDDARRLLLRTRIGKGLDRKHPDVLEESALPAVVATVSRVAADWVETVSEIEINPLMVSQDGVVAVDAVVTERPDPS